MNNQFDELTKSLAQSVTRREALKRFGVGVAGLALGGLGMNRAQAIINGTLDGNGHPNVGAGVFLKSLWPPTLAPVICGSAILVHPRVLVTSGHATYQIENTIAAGVMAPEDFMVSLGSNAADPSTWRTVCGIVTHPDFAPKSHYPDGVGSIPLPDIGALVLEEPAVGIAPAPLPPPGFLDDLRAAGELGQGGTRAKFTVVGYGVELGPNPGHIPFPPDGLRRVAECEFLNLHDRWLFVNQNLAHDLGGSCACDSGGPTLWADPATGETTLVAIVSRGSLYRDARYRVDTAEALSFLYEVIARAEAGQL